MYDLLDALIDRVPWRTETEVKQYKELIGKLRDINLFGYMAERTTVDKQFTQHPTNCLCDDCYDRKRERRYT